MTIQNAGEAPSTPQAPYVSVERKDGYVRGEFALPCNTSAAQYMEGLSLPERAPLEAPEPLCFADEGARREGEPFLTIVMRTQGKRLEELTDVMLCLAAQQDDDFELLVMGHKVGEDVRPALLDLLRELPEGLRSRIAYYDVDRGTRTTPLQIGFGIARGRYVAVLDDDDLIVDTWVSNFKRLAEEHDGRMLHSYVVTQDWSARGVSGEEGHRELRSDKTFDPSYCRDFDAAAQLSMNSCPLMGLAFPRYVFQDLRLDFDESLTTTEDWDFLMRVYSVCGVASLDEVTAIYRLWVNAESSHTLHDSREWDVNYALIVDKMNKAPYLLGAGAVDDVRSKTPSAATSREALSRSAELLLFGEPKGLTAVWDDVANLHEGKLSKLKSRHMPALLGSGEWDISFLFEGGAPAAMVALTPLGSPFKVLGEFTMRLTEVNGAQTTLDFADCAFHNGYQVDCNHIVYLKKDPFVAFELPHAMRLSRVDFAFKLLPSVPDFYIDQVAMGKTGLKIGRARRWFDRKLHGNG